MKNYSAISFQKQKSTRISNTPNYKNQNKIILNENNEKIKPDSCSNSIADSLRFFVDNSNTIKFINDPPKKAFSRKFSKDKLFKAIYHQDIFSRDKEKKRKNIVKNYSKTKINTSPSKINNTNINNSMSMMNINSNNKSCKLIL